MKAVAGIMRLAAILAGLTVAVAATGAVSGNLTISGQVNTVFAITVTADQAASQLDIENGADRTTVATINEVSNNPGGYKITMESQNNGRLVNDTNNSSSIAYQISYNGATDLNPSNSAQTVKTVGSLSSPANVQSTVAISFDGKADALGGTYSDRLTFEISAP